MSDMERVFGEVIDSRVANVLDRTARITVRLPIVTRSAIAVARRFYGGVWIGGRAVLRERSLQFAANSTNAAMHDRGTSFVVRLSRVRRITVRRGFVTDIITIVVEPESPGEREAPDAPGALLAGDGLDRLELRCWRAQRFAHRIEEAVAAL